MSTCDVRATAEPAKLKLVQGIVNKGTRDAQLPPHGAPASRGQRGRPGLPRDLSLGCSPTRGSREPVGVSEGEWV